MGDRSLSGHGELVNYSRGQCALCAGFAFVVAEALGIGAVGQ